MHEKSRWLRTLHERRIDLKLPEYFRPFLLLRFLPHARPDIGVDCIGITDPFFRDVRQLNDGAVPGRNFGGGLHHIFAGQIPSRRNRDEIHPDVRCQEHQ
jgi:hypothetical protein